MARVLVTGMSGTGKSTLLDELASRGHVVVDTDHGGWVLADGRWDEDRMARLLATHDTIAVSGTVENQGRFRDRFHHVVLLSAPLDVLLERLATRTTNTYGRTPEQQDEVRRYLADVEPRLRLSSSLELDGRLPVRQLGDVVDGLLRPAGGRPASSRRRRSW